MNSINTIKTLDLLQPMWFEIRLYLYSFCYITKNSTILLKIQQTIARSDSNNNEIFLTCSTTLGNVINIDLS